MIKKRKLSAKSVAIHTGKQHNGSNKIFYRIITAKPSVRAHSAFDLFIRMRTILSYRLSRGLRSNYME